MTDKEQWFWEQCGLRHCWMSTKDAHGHDCIQCENCGLFEPSIQCRPIVDLNNLFKYAVPRLGEWSLRNAERDDYE